MGCNMQHLTAAGLGVLCQQEYVHSADNPRGGGFQVI